MDDDNEMLDLVGSLLAQHRYNIVYASDGEAATIAANNSNPDLILLDIDLPKLTGLEVLHNLRFHPKTRDIPVIMMTGHHEKERVEKERVEKALNLGISDYLIKPFDGDSLIQRVEKALTESNR